MAAILNSAMLDSAICHQNSGFRSDLFIFWLRLTQKHVLPPLWLWLKLIQSDHLGHLDDTAILDSATLLSSAQIALKTLTHSSTLNLTQTNSIWLNLMMATIFKSMPSWIQPFCTKLWLKLVQSDSNSFILTQLDDMQPSWILPCWIQTLPSWIQTPCYLLSDSLKNTLPPLWLWLKLIPSD